MRQEGPAKILEKKTDDFEMLHKYIHAHNFLRYIYDKPEQNANKDRPVSLSRLSLVPSTSKVSRYLVRSVSRSHSSVFTFR